MKQKTIIAVSGTANVGKSMTLSRLGKQLAGAGATTTDTVTTNDYNAVLSYKSFTVGIQTYGDVAGWVHTGLHSFLAKKCDIIAIACKSYGATVNEIKTFAKSNNYRVIWTTPCAVWDGTIPENDIKDYAASHLKLMVDDIVAGSL